MKVRSKLAASPPENSLLGLRAPDGAHDDGDASLVIGLRHVHHLLALVCDREAVSRYIGFPRLDFGDERASVGRPVLDAVPQVAGDHFEKLDAHPVHPIVFKVVDRVVVDGSRHHDGAVCAVFGHVGHGPLGLVGTRPFLLQAVERAVFAIGFQTLVHLRSEVAVLLEHVAVAVIDYVIGKQADAIVFVDGELRKRGVVDDRVHLACYERPYCFGIVAEVVDVVLGYALHVLQHQLVEIRSVHYADSLACKVGDGG